MIDARGVVLVDAAVNPGANPIAGALSKRDRRQLAETVIDVLRVPARRALIDPTTSERYHEVGFGILVVPGSTPAKVVRDHLSLAALSTKELQRAARRFGMERLKLEVCPVVDRLGPIRDLAITANVPGRAAGPDDVDREHCTTWERANGDAPPRVFTRLPVAA